MKFLRAKFDENPDIKIAEDIDSISISDKFASGDYQKHEDSVYRIYHDIKLVCSILIHYYSQGTRSYQMVDKFYKFAAELILRECYRVGAKLVGDFAADIDFKESDFQKPFPMISLKLVKFISSPLLKLTIRRQRRDICSVR